jgi:hypothetical protein
MPRERHEEALQAAGAIRSGSIEGWVSTLGILTSVKCPLATSAKTRLAVSSVRVLLMWRLWTALMVNVVNKKRLGIRIPAE